ncbi:hypothetical protein FM109_15210 [Vibrio casei]|nr:hypothetical protein FM109_15210 [Vibrio casei]
MFHVIGLGCFSRPSQFLTGAFFIAEKKSFNVKLLIIK